MNISAQIKLPLSADPRLQDPALQGREGSEDPQHPIIGQLEAMGSGVIVDAKDGYILTNSHVINKADKITIRLSDGRSYQAKLIGSDKASDIAVLQIKAKNLHAISLGNSDKLQVGDSVLAIGNPFGLDQSVTSGIVSALQRANLQIEGSKSYENFIQTDAAINSGNSGGALVDRSGNLIGINTAIISPSRGSVGIGFAIPINMARSVMEQLIKYGNVKTRPAGCICTKSKSGINQST